MKAPFPALPARRAVERLGPETVFLVLACTFGLAVLLANAPFQAPDENDHFFRVFQLSEGTIVGEKRGDMAGGELPKMVIEATNSDGMPFHYDRKMSYGLFLRLSRPAFVNWSKPPRTYCSFPHTVVYGPTGYLPQTLAVHLGRHLRIGPLGLMYLARLAGFAASVALGYAALRSLPIYRWSVLVLLVCPMSLYLFGSIAPDGLLITGTILLLARSVRLAMRTDVRAGVGEQLLILALSGLLVASRPVYMPVAGVAWLLVDSRLVSPRGRILFGAAAILCCFAPVVVWAHVASALYVPGRGDIVVNPTLQARHIVEAPLGFIALVARSIRLQCSNNYRWMVGILGWGDAPMPGWFYSAFGYGILSCLLLESGAHPGLRWRHRAAMMLAAVACVALIYAAEYVIWNPPRSTDPIAGIQGRYFIPVAPLIILGLPLGLPMLHRFVVRVLGCALAVLCAATCLWVVILRFYGPASGIPSAGRTSRLAGVVTRAVIGAKERTLVTGLAVGGHGLERLLVRAGGSDLGKRGFSGALGRPLLRFLDSNGAVLAQNAGWGTSPDSAGILAASAAAGASPLAPDSQDSAVIVNVPEGNYTVEVTGVNGAGGNVQEEVYELSSNGTRLVNASSRCFVGTGNDVMVVSLIVAGTGTEPLLLRADGPSLAKFGVVGAMLRPDLEVSGSRGGTRTNTGWANNPNWAEVSAAASQAGAFPLARDGADCAVVVKLLPGAYTMRISGSDESTGVALAEIYELP